MILYRAADDADEVKRLGLPASQSFVPVGFFFGWLLENELAGPAALEHRRQFVDREHTGPELFARVGGELSSETIALEGLDFARDYVHRAEAGLFVDMARQFPLPSVFDVRDNWHNYEWMRIALVERYSQWRASRD